MDDLMGRIAAFHDAYGVEPVDVGRRAEATSRVTWRADACAQQSDALTQTLCTLLDDLESGASDAVLRAGFERTGRVLARLLLELYGTAALLGIGDIEKLVEREYASRMSAAFGA